MHFSIQTLLKNDIVRLEPLIEEDYEELSAVGCNPEVWINHTNNSRGTEDGFKVFFDGAIKSQGVYLIRDCKTNQTIGCIRFYDDEQENNSMFVGYNFFAQSNWDKGD